MQQPTINIMWFRRDLRLSDNAALYHALKSEHPVLPVFIFDREILDQLENKTDKRVSFIHAALDEMNKKLIRAGSSLETCIGKPGEVFNSLIKKYAVHKVFANHDYEPSAIKRDNHIASLLKENDIPFIT